MAWSLARGGFRKWWLVSHAAPGTRVAQSKEAGNGPARNVGQLHSLGKDFRLINNRQGGRRRGRGGGGGGRPPGANPNPGNRQDNRQRGNAAQLLEKYKGLARDAQMGGDRVQTEYYLQYADHYFRVLNESRARYEEQRRTRDDYQDEDEDQEQEAQASRDDSDRDYEDNEPQEREEPRREEPRREEPRREARNGEFRNRPRRERPIQREEVDEERIALDVLPPAISPANEAGEEEAPARAPRARRPRRPRDDDEDIAPAA
jgi:hypothetical protein